MKQVNLLSTAVLTGLLCASLNARAIPVPDFSSCSTTSGTGCLGIQNTGTGNNTVGIYGVANGWGVYGSSLNTGVYGSASNSTGSGVEGFSYSGTGVTGSSNNVGVVGVSTGSLGVEGAANQVNGIGVYGTGQWGMDGVGGNGGGGVGVHGHLPTPGSGYAIYGDNASSAMGSYAGYFRGNVYVTGTFSQGSDARLKKNIKPLEGAIDQVLKLHAVTFQWKNPEERGGTGTQRGFIAQDVEQVFPEWIGTDDKGFKTLDTRGIPPLLVESVRALKKENDALRSRMLEDEARLKALENRHSASSAGPNAGGVLGAAGLALFASALVLSRRRRGAPQS